MTPFLAMNVPDAPAMLALGARLGARLGAGDTLLLEGGLGAGKTTLARGIVGAATGETEVPSPTYTLVQVYGEDPEVWHADLYRLEGPGDVAPLGLLDVMDEVVALVEWPERLGGFAPMDALHVEIGFDGTGRIVTFAAARAAARDEWGKRLDGLRSDDCGTQRPGAQRLGTQKLGT